MNYTFAARICWQDKVVFRHELIRKDTKSVCVVLNECELFIPFA
jgi:hypothetical protein